MEIRRAEAQDIPQIVTLLYQVHKVHSDARPDLFRAGAKKYTAEELAELIPNDERPIFVAEKDGQILGYAFCIFQIPKSDSMQPIQTLYIDDLCVDGSIRGKGIGKALYGHVLAFAEESDCYNVTLNIWACNASAMHFYEKCGLTVQKIGMEQIIDRRKSAKKP